jgi:hypothetical protein
MAMYVLFFPSEQLLHSFVDLLGGKYTEINVRTLTLICECTSEDLEVATTRFGAKIVND